MFTYPEATAALSGLAVGRDLPFDLLDNVCQVQTLREHLQQGFVFLDALHELLVGELAWGKRSRKMSCVTSGGDSAQVSEQPEAHRLR